MADICLFRYWMWLLFVSPRIVVNFAWLFDISLGLEQLWHSRSLLLCGTEHWEFPLGFLKQVNFCLLCIVEGTTFTDSHTWFNTPCLDAQIRILLLLSISLPSRSCYALADSWQRWIGIQIFCLCFSSFSLWYSYRAFSFEIFEHYGLEWACLLTWVVYLR